MENKTKEINFRNNGRFGAIKNLGLSLRLPGLNEKTMPGIPEPNYRASRDYQNHLLEMERLRARARTDAQRFQFNR